MDFQKKHKIRQWSTVHVINMRKWNNKMAFSNISLKGNSGKLDTFLFLWRAISLIHVAQISFTVYCLYASFWSESCSSSVIHKSVKFTVQPSLVSNSWHPAVIGFRAWLPMPEKTSTLPAINHLIFPNKMNNEPWGKT